MEVADNIEELRLQLVESEKRRASEMKEQLSYIEHLKTRTTHQVGPPAEIQEGGSQLNEDQSLEVECRDGSCLIQFPGMVSSRVIPAAFDCTPIPGDRSPHLKTTTFTKKSVIAVADFVAKWVDKPKGNPLPEVNHATLLEYVSISAFFGNHDYLISLLIKIVTQVKREPDLFHVLDELRNLQMIPIEVLIYLPGTAVLDQTSHDFLEFYLGRFASLSDTDRRFLTSTLQTNNKQKKRLIPNLEN